MKKIEKAATLTPVNPFHQSFLFSTVGFQRGSVVDAIVTVDMRTIVIGIGESLAAGRHERENVGGARQRFQEAVGVETHGLREAQGNLAEGRSASVSGLHAVPADEDSE